MMFLATGALQHRVFPEYRERERERERRERRERREKSIICVENSNSLSALHQPDDDWPIRPAESYAEKRHASCYSG